MSITIKCGNITFNCPFEDVYITCPGSSKMRVYVNYEERKGMENTIIDMREKEESEVKIIEENVIPCVELPVILGQIEECIQEYNNEEYNCESDTDTEVEVLEEYTVTKIYEDPKNRSVKKKDNDPSHYLVDNEELTHSFGLKGSNEKATCISIFHNWFDVVKNKNICKFTIKECNMVPSFIGREFPSLSDVCKSFLKALVEEGLRDPGLTNSVNGWDYSKVQRNGKMVSVSKIRDQHAKESV
jgi:hypothetical protein